MSILTELPNYAESRSLAACYRLLIQAAQEHRQSITPLSQNESRNDKKVIEDREKGDSIC